MSKLQFAKLHISIAGTNRNRNYQFLYYFVRTIVFYDAITYFKLNYTFFTLFPFHCIILRTAGAYYFQPAWANRSDQSDFVIWLNSFSQLSADPKNNVNLDS